MLTWLNLASAWWLLLIPALLALYMLRQRPQRLRVSSLRLWRMVPQVEQARPRLRRPPLSLLLLLQAILLLVGAFALMQPALTAPAGKHLLILLDASGSMQAQNGGQSRFELARKEASNAMNSAGSTGDVTLLRVGDNVAVACASCTPGAARGSLNSLQPGSGTADVRGALGLATEQAQRWPGGTVETVLISDGGFDATTLDILPPALRVITVGGAVENRAITVVSARQPPDGTPGYEVYARVENFGTQSAAITVDSHFDTIPQPTRNMTLPAGGHADLIWQLPAGTARFSAAISPGDALTTDDQAVLLLPAGGHNKVQIAAPDAELYLRALAALPGLQPIIDDTTGDPDAAIAIASGSMPDPLPAGGVLLVNPDDSVLPSVGTLSAARPLPGAASHPLLNGIDLQALLVLRGNRVTPPDWLQTVVSSDQGPLILAGVRDGRRVVVLTFDPGNSNLTKLAAFPLLMANVVDWLYPLAGTQALSPGEAINLAPDTVVTTPSGRKITVGDSGVFADTEEAGLYSAASGALNASFAINMTDARESAAATNDHPELERQAADTPTLQLTQQQFWSPLAGIALILLSAEWLYYCLKRGRA